ncbi:ABC transporter permease [Anaerotruncus rubiinfantis]|uniref:ABC transporter permease n=1 Tax=Anaerotruncus rubiinfantis TaxID=1720200 RepID=UPI001899FBB0|nr:ABC transporter permease [Anaerotruncus rubiinfantis]
MTAIYKRELRSYLITPIGFVFLAIFYAIAGYYFFGYHLYGASADFSYMFSALFTFVIFITPLLTMRMFSEEKRYKTDQALLTAPVSLTSIVLGKYLASVTMFLAAQAVTLIYLVIVGTKGPVDYPVFFGHFIGMLLLGMALCALGMFISSLTESQIIAAVGGMGTGMLFMMIDSIGQMTGNPAAQKIFDFLSFYVHYKDFTSGILNIADILFFLSIAVLFCFLTVRVLEKRRWS